MKYRTKYAMTQNDPTPFGSREKNVSAFAQADCGCTETPALADWERPEQLQPQASTWSSVCGVPAARTRLVQPCSWQQFGSQDSTFCGRADVGAGSMCASVGGGRWYAGCVSHSDLQLTAVRRLVRAHPAACTCTVPAGSQPSAMYCMYALSSYAKLEVNRNPPPTSNGPWQIRPAGSSWFSSVK